MTTASWLITLAPLGLMFGYWFALPEHILVLVWWPLQSQERWSLWTLLALLIFTQASYFIAVLILPKGRLPSRRNWYDWALGTALFIYALGLIWAAQTTRGAHQTAWSLSQSPNQWGLSTGSIDR